MDVYFDVWMEFKNLDISGVIGEVWFMFDDYIDVIIMMWVNLRFNLWIVLFCFIFFKNMIVLEKGLFCLILVLLINFNIVKRRKM